MPAGLPKARLLGLDGQYVRVRGTSLSLVWLLATMLTSWTPEEVPAGSVSPEREALITAILRNTVLTARYAGSSKRPVFAALRRRCGNGIAGNLAFLSRLGKNGQ